MVGITLAVYRIGAEARSSSRRYPPWFCFYVPHLRTTMWARL